jgi:nitroreductase
MDFKETIYKRRAVNFFDPDRNVTDAQLRNIVELASQTPSSFNLQPWNLMILRDPDAKAKLRKLAWDQPKVTEAPVILVFLADRNGWQPNHPIVMRNFKEMVAAGGMSEEQRDWFNDACKSLYGSSDLHAQAFANKNTGFFAMAFMLAAKHLGLDTHPMDGFDHQGVQAAFNIPDNYWIPLLMAVGYFHPDQTLLPPKWRKSFDEIVVSF